jgi:uncharacterized membrane protein (DUF4010 family)
MDGVIARLGLALAIGLLVGLERGWRERDAAPGSRTAGIRTYGLAGLLGGIFAAVGAATGSALVLAFGFLGFALIFAWFQIREAVHDRNFSVTGVVAALAVFGLGALAVVGDQRAAAAGGAALAGVLASRELLHGLLKRLSWVELRSALVLAVMTAIGLPLLPDRTVDPWGGLNPHEIWFFTVLTAAISYLGYIAVRVLGPSRGLLVSGMAGALVSSTAVTVAFARRSAAGGPVAALTGAAALAAMVSIGRVVVVVAIVEPAVLVAILPAAAASAATFAAGGLFLLRRAGVTEGEAQAPQNPFDLAPLLLFAALFALVATISAAVVARFGTASLVATSGLSGMFDVDVAVLSALRLVDGGVAAGLAGQAVLAALAANGFGRLALAIAAGPLRYWLPLAGATVLAAGAGLAAFLFLPVL